MSVDPHARRWIALAATSTAAFVITLDSTVLNVALPTILRDFHTTLPTLEWVVTGYALTFAALLVIGGRLGDIHGYRRIFVLGAVLFSVGSLLAVASWSVGALIFGEAIIEGIGASLMMPATLAIISTTFADDERAKAFATWGAVVGVASALGPLVGGALTSALSWRWAFGLNLVFAPLAAIGVLVSVPDVKAAKRARLDVVGAGLVASGMFLVVLAITQSSRYGWVEPLRGLRLAGRSVWSRHWPLSFVPLVLGLGLLLLAEFVLVEVRKERDRADPLFEFSQFRHRGFRFGVLTSPIVGMTQLGLLFVLPVFLQQCLEISAVATGWWLLPMGLAIAFSASGSARMARRLGATVVVRIGMGLQCVGLVALAFVVNPTTSFPQLLLGMVVVGLGLGVATAQLTNVILADVEASKAGVASGINATVRQAGVAFGIAVTGAVLTSRTLAEAERSIRRAGLAPDELRRGLRLLDATGGSTVEAHRLAERLADALRHAVQVGVASGTRAAIIVLILVASVGIALASRIPRSSRAMDALETSPPRPLSDPSRIRSRRP